MNPSPTPQMQYPGSDYRRTLVTVSVIVLLIAAAVMFIGPSNIVQMWNLKDMETSGVIYDEDPYIRPIVTAVELKPYVVNRVPNPILLSEYMFTKSDEGIYTALYVFPVSPCYQLEIRVDDGNPTYVYLTNLQTHERLDMTAGVNGQVYDDFVHMADLLRDAQETVTDIP